MRPLEESSGELHQLLRKAKNHVHNANFAAASEILNQLFERWPASGEAGEVLAQIETAEEFGFRDEVNPLFENLRSGDLRTALSSLSGLLQRITNDVERLAQQPTAIPPQNDKAREADIASIRSALSQGLLQEAAARTQMAALSFPNSHEILGLESEVRELLRRDAQIKAWLEEAESHFGAHNWKAAIRLFNSAQRLDPTRLVIRTRMAEAFVSWAEELQSEDPGAALKLVETAVTFDEDSAAARKLQAVLAERCRRNAVEKAMNQARELEAKGDFTMAENAIRAAMQELPDQLTLVLYLKELDKTRRSKQYEGELRNIQNTVLNLNSRRQYVEAESALRQFLQKYPESATALTLLEGVQRDYQQHLNTQIADRALQDITPLSRGDLRALKRATSIADEALHKVGAEPRLTNAKQELELRMADSERNLAELLLRAAENIRHAKFNTALESLQSATAIDREDPRIEALHAQLRQERKNTRKTAYRNYVSAIRAGQRAAFTSLTLALSRISSGIATGVRRVGAALKMLMVASLSAGQAFFKNLRYVLGTAAGNVSRSGIAIQTILVKRRKAAAISIPAVLVVVAGVATYWYVRNLPEHAQLTITSSPEGAKVLIDGVTKEIADPANNTRIQELESRKARQKQAIETSISNGAMTAPAARNAIAALQDLETRFPSESAWVKEKREEVRRQIVTIAKKKCESQNTDCEAFAASALTLFPGDSDLQTTTIQSHRNNTSEFSPEVDKLAAQMENALKDRRYLLPRQNSAAYFAREIEKVAPAYNRLLVVRKIVREETDLEMNRLTAPLQESRALRSMAESEAVLSDFQRARNLLSAIDEFLPGEPRLGQQSTELPARIADVRALQEKRTYKVIHNHFVGECRGVLTISGYGVRFDPQPENDAFDRTYSEILFPVTFDGPTLQIKSTANKNWEFKLDRSENTIGSIAILKNQIDQMREIRTRIENKQRGTTSGGK